jgi:DNA-binding response OmpR family regulator
MIDASVNRRLLLVEDDPLLRDALVLLLENSGFAVHEAGNGAAALRTAAEHRPDLMLLDLGLPDMAGLDVVRQLKADPITAGIIVLAVTGRAGSEERTRCLSAGCDGYLVKPVPPRELVRVIREKLGN